MCVLGVGWHGLEVYAPEWTRVRRRRPGGLTSSHAETARVRQARAKSAIATAYGPRTLNSAAMSHCAATSAAAAMPRSCGDAGAAATSALRGAATAALDLAQRGGVGLSAASSRSGGRCEAMIYRPQITHSAAPARP
jgi:hypothetical protein